MDIIENFEWKINDTFYKWSYQKKEYKKQFRYVLRSIIELIDKSGFAIVGSYEEFGNNNAFIINADGTKRFSFTIPTIIKNAICFHEMYYINTELTAIIATRSTDIACVFDSKTGICLRTYETR